VTSDTLENILVACLFPSIPERRICDTSCLLGEHLFLLPVIGLCSIEIICFDRQRLSEQIMAVFILVMFQFSVTGTKETLSVIVFFSLQFPKIFFDKQRYLGEKILQ